jgi:hypothetical protein
MQEKESGGRWLLLIHQIPPKPDYLRVKIWRRLQRLGSVPVKNSVYVLPKSEQAQEDFQWVLREVIESGGDASLCEARFVDGLTDNEVEELFRSARQPEYREISREAERLRTSLAKKSKASGASTKQLAVELEKLQAEEFRDRAWVTRKGIHVDRMGSAWLFRRFIDPEAHFKFVPAKGYQPEPAELRFDMYEAEFTHEGDRCTFEVLLERFNLKDPALQSIAEIIHDIDLKDAKFAREETIGIDRLIAGIAMRHKDDEGRRARAADMFDDLYEYFKRKLD